MTMATSTVDRTTSWCPSLPTTTSCHSSTSQVLNALKFDACSKKHPSSTNLTILRVIPTRNSLQDFPDAVVDLLDDDDDERNTTTTTKLTPTNSDGPAAPLPYQSKLAAISAAIAKMQQRDDETSPHKRRTTTQPFDTKTELAAISAEIDRLKTKWPTVLPPPADLHLPLPAPPMPDSLLDDDGSNQHHDAQRLPSSINDVFKAQTPMLRTINTLLIKLLALVDLLLHATPKYLTTTSIQSPPPATVTPSTTTPTICHKTATQPPAINLQTTQIPPWPFSHTNPCNKCIPAKKISLCRKHIPAKPPFPGRAMTHAGSHAPTRTKDSMRPP